MSKNARGRASLWLIGALCAAPVFASYMVFYFAPPDGHANFGELLDVRPLPEASLQLADGTAFSLGRLKGKWVLLIVDTGDCQEYCQRKLFTLRQLRIAQGTDRERIERAWLISDAATPAVMSGFEGTWLVRAAGSELLKQLPAQRSPVDHIYVIDPLGNLVMRYARDAEPGKIIKDLTHLLKASRIG